MSKKVFLFFLSIIFFSSFNVARASLIFTEVMYYPSDGDTTGEWVELYNNGNSDILIKSDKDSYGTNAWKFQKGLTEYYLNSLDFTIGAGKYIVLANDSSLFNGVSYKVIDSSVSLSNINATSLAILDEAKVPVATLQYTPSAGSQNTGKSLQLIGGSWIGATPTPGITNNISATSPTTGGALVNNDSTVQNQIITETKTKIIEEPKIKTQITAQKIVFVGSSVTLEAKAFGYSKEPLHYGKYFWNFGDGDAKEIKANENQKLTHTYFYPGDYVVSLEYYMNYYSEIPDAFDQTIIKVMPADILISRVGDEKDFFVELSNNTSYDADISNWVLVSSAKSFIIPRNTIIGPEKKIIISSKITGMSVLDKDTLKLMTAQGNLVFDYASFVAPVTYVHPLLIEEGVGGGDLKELPPRLSGTPPQKGGEESVPLSLSETEIPTEDLEALAVESMGDNITQNSFSYFPTLISMIFIGASAGAVYFIRQKKVISKTGDDFEILDE
jgi:hypothetical protein